MTKPEGGKLSDKDVEAHLRRYEQKKKHPQQGTSEPDDPSPDPGDRSGEKRKGQQGRS